MSIKLSIITIVLILILATIYAWQNKDTWQSLATKNQVNNSTNEQPTDLQPQAVAEQEVTDAFSNKYSRPAEEAIVEIIKFTETHAKGSIRFADEAGGGLWFAAKTDKGWELAFDGNGIIGCEIANKYDFPKDMIPSCVDKVSGELLQR